MNGYSDDEEDDAAVDVDGAGTEKELGDEVRKLLLLTAVAVVAVAEASLSTGVVASEAVTAAVSDEDPFEAGFSAVVEAADPFEADAFQHMLPDPVVRIAIQWAGCS